MCDSAYYLQTKEENAACSEAFGSLAGIFTFVYGMYYILGYITFIPTEDWFFQRFDTILGRKDEDAKKNTNLYPERFVFTVLAMCALSVIAYLAYIVAKDVNLTNFAQVQRELSRFERNGTMSRSDAISAYIAQENLRVNREALNEARMDRMERRMERRK